MKIFVNKDIKHFFSCNNGRSCKFPCPDGSIDLGAV